jgi:hypothetical protein
MYGITYHDMLNKYKKEKRKKKIKNKKRIIKRTKWKSFICQFDFESYYRFGSGHISLILWKQKRAHLERIFVHKFFLIHTKVIQKIIPFLN